MRQSHWRERESSEAAGERMRSEGALAWQKQESSPKDAWQRARGQRRLANGSSELKHSRRQLDGNTGGRATAMPKEVSRKAASHRMR